VALPSGVPLRVPPLDELGRCGAVDQGWVTPGEQGKELCLGQPAAKVALDDESNAGFQQLASNEVEHCDRTGTEQHRCRDVRWRSHGVGERLLELIPRDEGQVQVS